MAEGDTDALTSSPGARLQVARVQAGLSPSQAAERLHLDEATLSALESGRLEGLGAAVFVRGHLRRYAELVNIPESDIMAAYDAWSGRLASQPDLRGVITAPAVRSGTRRFEVKPREALIVAIVLVLVALVWWAMHKAPRVVSAQATPPKAAAPALNQPANQPVNQEPPAKWMPAAAAAAPAAAAPVRLELSFNADSWAEIYGADGTQLFRGIAQAGSKHHVIGSPPLRIFFGNPSAVALDMDGHPLAWTTATGAAKPRRFLLDGNGHAVEASASRP